MAYYLDFHTKNAILCVDKLCKELCSAQNFCNTKKKVRIDACITLAKSIRLALCDENYPYPIDNLIKKEDR